MINLQELIEEKIRIRKKGIQNISHPIKQQKEIRRMNRDILILEFLRDESKARADDDKLSKKIRDLLKFFDEELYE